MHLSSSIIYLLFTLSLFSGHDDNDDDAAGDGTSKSKSTNAQILRKYFKMHWRTEPSCQNRSGYGTAVKLNKNMLLLLSLLCVY